MEDIYSDLFIIKVSKSKVVHLFRKLHTDFFPSDDFFSAIDNMKNQCHDHVEWFEEQKPIT